MTLVLALLACASDDCGPGPCVTPGATDDEPPTCDGIGGEVDGVRPDVVSVCATCVTGGCAHRVDAADDVVAVELDLWDGSWSEYHDAFVTEGDGVFALSLQVVTSYDDYESGRTTRLDLGDADVASATTLQYSAVDAEGAYVACVAVGPDAGSAEGCVVLP